MHVAIAGNIGSGKTTLAKMLGKNYRWDVQLESVDDNPYLKDFYEDMKRFKWVKRLLNKFKNTGDLNVHLVMNHFIILYNVFGDATTPLLFYKLDKDLWSILKTFVIYLERLPEFPITALHDIPVDEKCLQLLNDL